MNHTVPYLILSFISAAVLLYVLLRARSYATFVLFLNYVGNIYLFEFIILVLFNSYDYYPHLLKNPYLDSMVGAFVSNFFAIPVTSIAIVTFRLRYRWSIFFSVLFSSIELLYLKLGIFEHHWWRTPYTTVSLLFFFWLNRYWADQVARGNRLFTYATLLMFSLTLIDTLMFFLMLSGFGRFRPGIFSNPTHDNVFMMFILAAFNASVLSAVIYRTYAIRPIIAALAILFAVHVALHLTGILQLYISSWAYYSIHASCCMLITWLLVKAKHSFASLRMRHKQSIQVD